MRPERPMGLEDIVLKENRWKIRLVCYTFMVQFVLSGMQFAVLWGNGTKSFDVMKLGIPTVWLVLYPAQSAASSPCGFLLNLVSLAFNCLVVFFVLWGVRTLWFRKK